MDHIHVHADIVKNVQEHMPREEELRDWLIFLKYSET